MATYNVRRVSRKRVAIPVAVLALQLFAAEAVEDQLTTLCAALDSDIGGGSGKGAFIGLASDHIHQVKVGSDGVERWTTIKADEDSEQQPGGNPWGPPPSGSIRNSFTGEYLQVLPDDRDSFGGNDPGPRVKQWVNWHAFPDVEALTTTTLSFSLHVGESGGGMHTLFLRWTGGDLRGAGDSMYVAMFDDQGRVVPGPDAVKPTSVPIDDPEHDFLGCCYNMKSHACPCFKEPPGEDKCPTIWGGRDGFIAANEAKQYGIMCDVGNGVMDIVRAPRWFEFAGQEEGNVMDFDSEPWDATCEAEGQSTIDSGRDFATWDLEGGKDYTITFFPREDGTAFDAFYLAGPKALPPSPETRLKAGASTVCTGKESSKSAHIPTPDFEETSKEVPSGRPMLMDGDDDGGRKGTSSITVVIGVVLVIFAAIVSLRGALYIFPSAQDYIVGKLEPYRERLQQMGINLPEGGTGSYNQMQSLDDFSGSFDYVPPQNGV